MEQYPLQYAKSLPKLVHIVGNLNLSQQAIKCLKESKSFDDANFTFMPVGNEMTLPPRKDKRLNSKGHSEGILRSNWLDKRLYQIPSLVIFIYDWSGDSMIDWKDREASLVNDFNKYKENLRARQIDVIVIVLLGKSLSYSMGMEEGTLKKQLEIDSKCLLTSQGGAEQLPALIKKADKMIQDLSKEHYKNLFKKHEKRMKTGTDQFIDLEFKLRITLKKSFLLEFMGKNDKSLVEYNMAYTQIQYSLLDHYTSIIEQKIKNLSNYLAQNYEYYEKLEELRYLTDIIIIRQIYFHVQKEDYKTAYLLFGKHIQTFKHKINYYDPRFEFEEFKWRSRFYNLVAFIMMNAFQTTKKVPPEEYLTIHSTLFGYVDANMKRRASFLKQNQAILADTTKPNVVADPHYLGYDQYKTPHSDTFHPHMYGDLKFTNEILKYRLMKEKSIDLIELNLKALEKLQEYSVKFGRPDFMIQATLAENYFIKGIADLWIPAQLNIRFKGNEDAFLNLSAPIVKALDDKRWVDPLQKFLNMREQILLKRKESLSLLENTIRMLLVSEYTEERSKTIDRCLENFQSSSNMTFLIQKRNILNARASFSRRLVGLFEDFDTSFEITIPEWLQKIVSKLNVCFNDKSYNKAVTLDKLEKVSETKFKGKVSNFINHNAKLASLFVDKIILEGTKEMEGHKLSLTFELHKSYFRDNEANQALIEFPEDLAVDFKFRNPGYIGEPIPIEMSLKKKKGLSCDINNITMGITLLSNNTIWQEIEESKNPLAERGFSLAYFDAEDAMHEYSKNISLKILEFGQGQDEIKMKFLYKSTEELKRDFSFKIRYFVAKEIKGESVKISLETNKKLTIQTVFPLTVELKWKLDLGSGTNREEVNSNVANLPLGTNNLALANITPINDAVIIKSIKSNLSLHSGFIQLLQEPEAKYEMELNKGERYCSNLIVRTLKPCENMKIGDLDVYIKRMDEKDMPEIEPLRVSISLQAISIRPSDFTVKYICGTDCVLGDTIKATLRIKNNTNLHHKLDLTVVENDQFLSQGHTRKIADIFSGDVEEFTFIFLPVSVGKLKLPLVIVKCLTIENLYLLTEQDAKVVIVTPAPQLA